MLEAEDAMLSNNGRGSSKKRKIPAFTLVGKPRQVSFDHQKMAELEGRIEKAALVIKQKAITRKSNINIIKVPRDNNRHTAEVIKNRKHRFKAGRGQSEQFLLLTGKRCPAFWLEITLRRILASWTRDRSDVSGSF